MERNRKQNRDLHLFCSVSLLMSLAFYGLHTILFLFFFDSPVVQSLLVLGPVFSFLCYCYLIRLIDKGILSLAFNMLVVCSSNFTDNFDTNILIAVLGNRL